MGAPTKQTDPVDLSAIGAQVYHAVNGNASTVGPRGEDFFVQPLRLLLSFHYYKAVDVDALLTECFGDVPLDLFADSGAYSAFTMGAPLDVEAYCAWVARYKHRFTVIAGPDVIGDPEATFRATERMMHRFPDCTILPTFHVREAWSWLERARAMAPYIAFGGMVPFSRDAAVLPQWIAAAFSRLSSDTRVHGFGMTSWPLMRQFPWHSVDSSSWTSVFRFGTLSLFDEARGAWVQVELKNPKAALPYAALLATYGLRPTDLRSKGYDRDRICGASIRAWRRAERWLSVRRATACYGPGVYATTEPGAADPGAARNARGLGVYGATNSTNDPSGNARGIGVYAGMGEANAGSNVGGAGVAHALRTYGVSVPGDSTPNSPRRNAAVLNTYLTTATGTENGNNGPAAIGRGLKKAPSR